MTTDYDNAVAQRRDRIRARKSHNHQRLTALGAVGIVIGAGLVYLFLVGVVIAVVIAVAVFTLRALGVL